MKTEIIQVGCKYFIDPTLEHISKREALKICKNPEKFIGFTNIPYSYRNIKGYYNLQRDSNTRVRSNGSTETIETYLKSIFKEDFEKAIRYLFHLAWNTEKKLPTLNVYSDEQTTGKTTFLAFVRLLDFGNSICIENKRFYEPVNDFWVSKNIICVDEIPTDYHSFNLIGRLTSLKYILRDQKYVDCCEIPFHGSFIVATQIQIGRMGMVDPNRFWSIPLSKIENPNPLLLLKLKAEIPAFLGKLLMNRTEICSYLTDNPLDF